MFFKQIPVGRMQNFSYIIADPFCKEAAVIDPGFDYKKILKEAEKHNLKITKILLTHAHFDHITDVPKIIKETKAEVYVHKLENLSFQNLHYIKDKDTIQIGKIKIKVIHTPGHTEGSVCFLAENKLLTGDTLFVGGIGRTDLPESNKQHMKKSLKKLIQLNENIEVYPGHDYGNKKSSTIIEEKRNNPFIS